MMKTRSVDSASARFGLKMNAFLILTNWLMLWSLVDGSPINRQAGISENVYITVQNDTYGIEQRVCSIESQTYDDGESIPTSSPCEHCICRPPGFACTIISCEYRPGCKALKRSDQCCPEYQCECEKNGKIYQNGEKILDDNNPCEVCYCRGGDVICAIIDCYWRSDCQPRYIENRCCPLYDHCPPPSEHGPIRPTHRPTTISTTTFSNPINWFNMSSAIYATPTTTKKPLITTTSASVEAEPEVNYVTPIDNSLNVPTLAENDVDYVPQKESLSISEEPIQNAPGEINNAEEGALVAAESVSEQNIVVPTTSTEKSASLEPEQLNSIIEQDKETVPSEVFPEVANYVPIPLKEAVQDPVENSSPIATAESITQASISDNVVEDVAPAVSLPLDAPIYVKYPIVEESGSSLVTQNEEIMPTELPNAIPVSETVPVIPLKIVAEPVKPETVAEPLPEVSHSDELQPDVSTVHVMPTDVPLVETQEIAVKDAPNFVPTMENHETTAAPISLEVEPVVSDVSVPESIPLIVDEPEPIISEVTVQDEATSEVPIALSHAQSDVGILINESQTAETATVTEGTVSNSLGDDAGSLKQAVVADVPEINPTDVAPSEVGSFPSESITYTPTTSYVSTEYLMSTVVANFGLEEASSVESSQIMPTTTIIIASPSIVVVTESEEASAHAPEGVSSNSGIDSAPAVDTELDVTVPPEEDTTGHDAVLLPAPIPDDIPKDTKQPEVEVLKVSSQGTVDVVQNGAEPEDVTEKVIKTNASQPDEQVLGSEPQNDGVTSIPVASVEEFEVSGVTQSNVFQEFSTNDVPKPSQVMQPPKFEFGGTEPPKVSTDFGDLATDLVPPKEETVSGGSVPPQVNPVDDDPKNSDVTTQAVTLMGQDQVVPEDAPVIIVDMDTGLTEHPYLANVEVQYDSSSLAPPPGVPEPEPTEQTTATSVVQNEQPILEEVEKLELPVSQPVDVENEVKVDDTAEIVVADDASAEVQNDGSPVYAELVPGITESPEVVTNPPQVHSSSESSVPAVVSKDEDTIVFDENVVDHQAQPMETTEMPSKDASVSESQSALPANMSLPETVAELIKNVTQEEIQIDPIMDDPSQDHHLEDNLNADSALTLESSTTAALHSEAETTPASTEERFRLDLDIFSDEGGAKAETESPMTEMATESQVVFETIHPDSHLPESMALVQKESRDDPTDIVPIPITENSLNDETSTYSPEHLQRHHLPGHEGVNEDIGTTENVEILADNVESVQETSTIEPSPTAVNDPTKFAIPAELVKRVDPISDDIGEDHANADLRSDADNEVSNVDSTWYWRSYDRIRSLFPAPPLKSSRKPRSTSEAHSYEVKYWGLPRLLFW